MRRRAASGRGRPAQRNAKKRPQNDHDELRVGSAQDGENPDRNERDTCPAPVRAQAPRHIPHGLRNDRDSDELQPVDQPATDGTAQ